MTARSVVTDALVVSSLVVVVLSAFGALVLPSTYSKLHYLTPVTTVAVPLFVAALIVAGGWGITAGLELLIGFLLVLSGPVLQVSIGRIQAQQDGVLHPETPQ